VSENDSGDDFFDKVSSGPTPSAKLSQINDGVVGEVLDTYKVDKIKFGTKDVVERDTKTNEPIKQLVVVLQTAHRNWENVSKVPLVDREDKSKGDLPPEADEGRRAVYIPPWTNIHAEVGKAVKAANAAANVKGGIKVGAQFGVKVVDLEPTDKGNPKKIHAAKYVLPSATDSFFDNGPAASTPAPSAPAEPTSTAAAAAVASKPASEDPWGTPQSSTPPF
jgi:hypothetical protein